MGRNRSTQEQLCRIVSFDPKRGPAKTTTLQQKPADRRGYSDGPNSKKIAKLIRDNQTDVSAVGKPRQPSAGVMGQIRESEGEKANANRRSTSRASVPHAGSEEMGASLSLIITNRLVYFRAFKKRTTTGFPLSDTNQGDEKGGSVHRHHDSKPAKGNKDVFLERPFTPAQERLCGGGWV